MAVFSKMGAMVATVTVANDGSGNFNCNGINDEVDIQAAIDHCAGLTDGGAVYIKDGSYSIGAAIVLAPNVTVFGAGYDTRFELDFDGVMWDTTDQINTNMGLHYMRIDGNSAARAAGTAVRWYGAYVGRISGLYIHDFDDNGIQLLEETGGSTDTKGVFMSDIQMTNAGITGAGLYLDGVTDCRFNNLGIGFSVDAAYCIYMDTGGSGMIFNNTHVWADGAGATTGIGLTVNSFRTTWTGVYGGGMNMDHLISINGHGHSITGVVGENCTVSMIEFLGDYCTFGDAYLLAALAYTMYFTSSTYNMVSNALIRDSVDVGIFGDANSDYNSFSNVRTVSCDSYGWRMQGDHWNLSNCSSEFDGNHGFYLDGTDYNTFVGCRAYENVAGHGFYVLASDKNQWVGCFACNNDAVNMRGWHFGGVSIDNILSGCFAENNDDWNVYIGADADAGVIMGCRFDNTGMTDNINDLSGGTWLYETATDSDPLNELT